MCEDYQCSITYCWSFFRKVAEAIRSETVLVSLILVNNEVGVIQKVQDIGKLCRDNGVLFHTDAAQACGKIPVDVQAMNIDLLSISGHKMYGPKGRHCSNVALQQSSTSHIIMQTFQA